MIDASSNWRTTSFRCVLLFFIITFSGSAFSQNLLTNGDFEQGNNVGFSSNYGFIPTPTGNTSAGQYGVGTNPQPYNTSSFISMGDHTTGTGNMMIVDGTNNSGNPEPFFWRVNNNGEICGLTVGVKYTFSYWIKSIYSASIPGASVAEVRIKWNNIQGGQFISPVSGSTFAPPPGSNWQKVTYEFIPTNACVRIEMFDQNGGLAGNDFAIDDMELLPPPEPLSISYSAINSTCTGASNGSIVVYGIGGIKPYASYSLSGTSSQTNTSGIFTGLGPGTYSVSVTDANSQTVSVGSIVITEPSSLSINASNTSVCAGDNVTLTANGGTTYSWTAVPADPSLTNPTGNPVTVQPAVTTTYTVSSPSTSTQQLLFNRDFSLGNVGFATDYKFLGPTNTFPSGLQRAYGVSSSPKVWFNGFDACVDKTTGTGNMMVIDGSTFSGGNDRVWCQTVPVVPSQTYTFSYFIQSLVASNPAKIEVLINNVSLGAPVLAPTTSCNWQQRTYTWNSGAATLAQICIYDREILSAGNDFALDDLSFTTTSTCTNKVSATINVNNCGCPDISNASSAQTLCVGGDPSAFSVNTNVVGANSITYKYYTSQQTGNAMYAGGTVLGNVTPSGGAATYNAGVLGTAGSLPNTPGTYYVYATVNPTPANAACRPFQEIIVIITAANTVTAASSSPTLCINTPLTNITHTTTGATGIGTATGLPNGVTAIWNASTITISGTPTASGTFSYTIPLTGGCGTVNATGTITVTANNTVTAASSSPTLCINTPLTNITHTTTGATGIGSATGLPAGVTASWNAGTITISGTPTASGTFSYTIPLTGGCGTVNATGTITVTAANTVTAASSSPSVCLGAPTSINITHTTTGATGIGTSTGLPAGVTATWNAGTLTISGIPTGAAGTYNYTIPLTGGCGTVSATGTITVTSSATLTLTSGNDNQSVCGTSTAITPIVYTLGAGATGVTQAGLPAGVTVNTVGNTATISGTPSTSTGSPFTYTLTTTGGSCTAATQTGSITVNLLPTIVLNTGNNNQTTCVNAAIGSIGYTFGGSATTTTVSGLPAGVTSSISGTTLTISGTPTTSAGSPFSYTVVTSGGSCGTVSLTGTITVSPLPTLTPASGSTTQTVCANTAIGTITYTLGGGATGATVTGLPTGVNFSVNGSTVTISGTPTTASANPFIYTVTTIGGGCGTATQTGTITVNTNPTITLTSGNAAQSLCVNRAITPIVYTFSGGATGATVTGLPAGVTAAVSGSTVTISGTPTAASTVPFTYTVTTTGGGCGTANRTGTLTVNPIPVVSAGPDRQVELGKTVVLNGTSSGSNNTILWTPPTGLSSTNTLTPVATITQTTTYTLTVTSAAGCTASDQVVVTLLRPIDVPNVFSPNGDGVHDRWVIRNIELYTGSVVQIFNRYGSLIFERFGYNSSNAWDGTFNGKPMPVGAYYYTIRLSQDKQPVAGTISIIR